MITACLTYAIVLVAYYFVQTGYSAGYINQLDNTVAVSVQNLATSVAKPFRSKSAVLRKLASFSKTIADSNLLYDVLLAFSDQQLVTGLGILTLGFAQLESVTEYHFAIVQSLAKLSFVVHDTTTVLLEDDILKDPVKRTWRGVAIISHMLLTLVIQLPIGNNYWLESFGMPTECIWNSFQGNYDPSSMMFAEMVLTTFFLFWGVLMTLGTYFPTLFGRLADNSFIQKMWSAIIATTLWPRKCYNESTKRLENSQTRWGVALNTFLTRFWLSFAVVMFALVEIFTSEAWNLQGNWFILVNSVSTIFYLRSIASENGREGDENAWGFGQAVPMFMLILPFATVVETCSSKSLQVVCLLR